MRKLNVSASGRPQVASPPTARGAGGRGGDGFADADQDLDESVERVMKQGDLDSDEESSEQDEN